MAAVSMRVGVDAAAANASVRGVEAPAESCAALLKRLAASGAPHVWRVSTFILRETGGEHGDLVRVVRPWLPKVPR